MTIRERADAYGVIVVGKIARKPDDIWVNEDGEKEYLRLYIDEVGNEFYVQPGLGCVAIVTADGGVC